MGSRRPRQFRFLSPFSEVGDGGRSARFGSVRARFQHPPALFWPGSSARDCRTVPRGKKPARKENLPGGMAWCPTLANPKKPSRHGAFSCTDPRAAFRVAFGPDSEERCMGANADVIRQAWEAFGQQDLDGATADMDGDAEVIVPESLPWGGTYRGPDGFKEMVGQFLSQFEDFRPDIEGVFEAENDLVSRLTPGAAARRGRRCRAGALALPAPGRQGRASRDLPRYRRHARSCELGLLRTDEVSGV